MGISVADNFDHKSKKPLDARTSYATLAQMKAVTDANINEGCFAYCAETDKYYTFKSTNTVDDTLGKWREYGVEEMPSEDMADIITPLPSARPAYHKYSTEEQTVGEWIGGATLYEKTLQITMPSANESSISTGVENGNHARIVAGFIEQTGSSGGNYSFPIMFDSGSPLTTKVLIQVTVSGSHLYVYSNFDKTDGKTAYVTIQYTKNT